MLIYWCPKGAKTMGILAINAMNTEGQVGIPAITGAASDLGASADFATQLDRKLQGDTNPTRNSATGLSPEVASRTAKDPSTSKAAPPVAGSTLPPSQAAQDVAAGKKGCAHVTGSVPTQARVVTLQATTGSSLDQELQRAGVESTAQTEDSRDKVKPTAASPTNITERTEDSSSPQPSSLAQEDIEGQEGSALVTGKAAPAVAGSTLPPSQAAQGVPTENSQDKVKQTGASPTNIAGRAEDSRSPQPSSLPQGVIAGQAGPAPVKGSAPTWKRIEGTSLSDLGKGLQSAGVARSIPIETAQATPASPKTEASQDRGSKASSAGKAAPAVAGTPLPPSRPTQVVATGKQWSTLATGKAAPAVAGPTFPPPQAAQGVATENSREKVKQAAAAPTNITGRTEDGSSSPPSRLAQRAVAGQVGPAPVTGNAAPAVASSNLTPSQGTQGVATENSQDKVKQAAASPTNITAQIEDSSSPPPSRLAQGVVAGQDGPAPVTGKAAPAVASSSLPPSRTAQPFATRQGGFANVAGSAPTSKGTGALDAASPGRVTQGLRIAGGETRAPLQNAATPLEPLAPSSVPEVSAGQQAGSGLESPANASDATDPQAPVSTPGWQSPDLSLPVPFELVQAGQASPKTDADKGTNASSANKAVAAEAGSSLPPSQAAQAVAAGQAGSAPVKGSAPTWDRIEAASLSSLGRGLQPAGAETPLHQRTIQLEQQEPSSAPEARTRQAAESGPESPASTHVATNPATQLSAPSPFSPDLAPIMPLELTQAVLTGRADGPQNSNPGKNSGENNSAASGANSAAAPDGTPASVVQYPAQAPDIDSGSSVRDTKQADASADKKGGEAAQDLTQVVDGKGSLPKASADPALAPQPVPEGRAEAGRTSPAAAGASQGRGEAASSGALEGYQANADAVVRSARFTQQAGNAEMQVRLRSEAFGPIDVHTIVKGSEIGASIRVEARDTQVMLANELSQLEQALHERSLCVEHLDVLQGSVSGGQSDGTGSGNTHGSPSEPRQSFSSYSAGQTYTSMPELPTVSEDWGLGVSTTRINLRV